MSSAEVMSKLQMIRKKRKNNTQFLVKSIPTKTEYD